MSTRGEDRAADGGSARYGSGPGTGANEPKRGEKKEQHEDWVPRQGGDQARDGSARGEDRGDAGGQARALDEGVDGEHLASPSEGVRPEENPDGGSR